MTVDSPDRRASFSAWGSAVFSTASFCTGAPVAPYADQRWVPAHQRGQFNTLWDGIFHLSTYVFVVAGLLILWKRAHRATCAGREICSPERC